tara:strand:+ start:6005 stop:6310 length:306 start_codon:yes stop_codon:yes gene_type:complete
MYRKRIKRSKCRTHKRPTRKRCASKKGCRITKKSARRRAFCRKSRNIKSRKTRRGGGCGCAGGLQSGGLHPLSPASTKQGSTQMVNAFPQWSPGQRALGAS